MNEDEPRTQETVSEAVLREPEAEERVVLTDRDIEIFKLIHEQRFVAHGHIRTAFWYDCSEEANACHRRKVKLIKAGYLKQKYSKKKGLEVYYLTEKAFEELKTRSLDSDLPHYKITPDFDRFIDHDLKVTAVRVMFRRFGLKDWMGERWLKYHNFIQPVPDGYLTVKGFKIAVEFENFITKGLKRYVELFDAYRHADYHLVLMILDGDVKDWLELLPSYDPSQVWFTSLTEFMKKKADAMFSNRRASFMFRELIP